MAMINLDTDRIYGLNAEINASNSALFNNYFPALESELNNILLNVQGNEINEVLTTICTEFNDVKTTLNKELPRLQQFLMEQLGGYVKTEEQLTEDLMNLMLKMTEHIYQYSYIGPAGFLNLANSKTPQQAALDAEKFLRPESVMERQGGYNVAANCIGGVNTSNSGMIPINPSESPIEPIGTTDQTEAPIEQVTTIDQIDSTK